MQFNRRALGSPGDHQGRARSEERADQSLGDKKGRARANREDDGFARHSNI